MAEKKVRIDRLLVQRGLAESRTSAQRLVMAGQVRAGGQTVHKSSMTFDPCTELEVEARPRYVSRAGEKLEVALESFNISPADRICADVGSSTGGFTDCLLQQQASRVYAIDAGKGQLHWKLRQDSRVVLLENTNARYLDELPEIVSLVTIDVSFISALRITAQAVKWIEPTGDLVLLIKPQFEAGPENVGPGGIVTDPGVHREVVQKIHRGSSDQGLYINAIIGSPVLGAKGNQEYLAWLRLEPGDMRADTLIDGLFQ